MKIVDQSIEILTYDPIDMIEKAARTCYKSEDLAHGEPEVLVDRLMRLGHYAMLEHAGMSVKFVCDRAIANEIVRHRLFSFAQESTRWCDYSKEKFDHEVTVIDPGLDHESPEYCTWSFAMSMCESAYMAMIHAGVKPEIARKVLPLGLKTELVVTGNYREWRHFCEVRYSKTAHPEIRQLVKMVVEEMQPKVPIIFDGIVTE